MGRLRPKGLWSCAIFGEAFHFGGKTWQNRSISRFRLFWNVLWYWIIFLHSTLKRTVGKIVVSEFHHCCSSTGWRCLRYLKIIRFRWMFHFYGFYPQINVEPKSRHSTGRIGIQTDGSVSHGATWSLYQTSTKPTNLQMTMDQHWCTHAECIEIPLLPIYT